MLAHEYGHHVQDLLGTEAQVRRPSSATRPTPTGTRSMLELQADCYAGVWAKHATETTDAGGQPLFTSITAGRHRRGARSGRGGRRRHDPEEVPAGGSTSRQFTHGSSAQRQQWFDQGYQTGDPKQCDTFGNA